MMVITISLSLQSVFSSHPTKRIGAGKRWEHGGGKKKEEKKKTRGKHANGAIQASRSKSSPADPSRCEVQSLGIAASPRGPGEGGGLDGRIEGWQRQHRQTWIFATRPHNGCYAETAAEDGGSGSSSRGVNQSQSELTRSRLFSCTK